jgi:hypothetical protein
MRLVKAKAAFIAASVITAFGMGCVPERYATLPGASGRVVASGSGMPVAGASVTVRVESSQGLSTRTMTSQDGQFLIPAAHKWHVRYLCVHDRCMYVMPPATLTAQHEGYQPYAVSFGPVDKLAAGDIELQEVPR